MSNETTPAATTRLVSRRLMSTLTVEIDAEGSTVAATRFRIALEPIEVDRPGVAGFEAKVEYLAVHTIAGGEDVQRMSGTVALPLAGGDEDVAVLWDVPGTSGRTPFRTCVHVDPARKITEPNDEDVACVGDDAVT